jgi:hypothetical protein
MPLFLRAILRMVKAQEYDGKLRRRRPDGYRAGSMTRIITTLPTRIIKDRAWDTAASEKKVAKDDPDNRWLITYKISSKGKS